jgi:ABC-type lipoprotein export system ATPase subunit
VSAPGAAALLDLRAVWRVYQQGPERVEALRGVDLSLERGRIGVILGSSGSGKTTLLHVAGGVERPTSGEVILEGTRLDALSEAGLTHVRRRRIGMIFQDYHLMPGLTALENVRLPLLFSGRSDEGRAEDLLGQLGLRARRDFEPRQLSGGEQQRVAIARALIHGPALLLADEPTGNLDSGQAGRILDLLRSLAGSLGLTVLVATHDQELAGRADIVWHLHDGRILPQAAAV